MTAVPQQHSHDARLSSALDIYLNSTCPSSQGNSSLSLSGIDTAN